MLPYPYNKVGELISIAKEVLSEKAYREIVRIVEKELNMVIDLGLEGEKGPSGPNYPSENKSIISSIPDLHTRGET